MPPILARTYYFFPQGLDLQGIILTIQRLFCIFVRPIQDRDEEGAITRPTSSSPSPIYDRIKPPRIYKRKALLVGVESKGSDKDTPTTSNLRPLKGPHRDIQDMRQLLIERWHYDPDDIALLINTDDPEQAKPTGENVKKHCVELVAGACKGDRFFFLFSGHTTQRLTENEEEEDGKDEYIVGCDGQIIQDNILRAMLVEPLPAGSKLVAVFDACNSGTLLDLEHYRCNRVYVPWINKEFRRTRTQWNTVVRGYALAGRIKSPSRSATMPNVQENGGPPLAAVNSPSNSTSMSSVLSPTILPANVVAEMFQMSRAPSRRTSMAVGPPPDGSGRWYNCPETPVVFCDSPVARFCTGHCRTNGQYVQQSGLNNKADVICLSAAKDSQRSWQNAQGSSMTQALIKFLRNTPDATMEGVLTSVSHELHEFYLDLHQGSRQYKRQMRDLNKGRWIRGKPPRRRRTVEMDNFQDPQISSLIPLDMKRLWQM